jgi:hypothetical protein
VDEDFLCTKPAVFGEMVKETPCTFKKKYCDSENVIEMENILQGVHRLKLLIK